MLLQLLTLGVAADADSNARRAANYAKQGLDAALGASSNGQFVVFNELDYNWEWYKRKWYSTSVPVSTGKTFTRRSIPISRIKEMRETAGFRYDDDYGLNHKNRLARFHEGPLLVIETFDGVEYYLDGGLDDLTFAPKEAAKSNT